MKDMKEEALNLSKQRALLLWCDMLLVLLNIVVLLVLLMVRWCVMPGLAPGSSPGRTHPRQAVRPGEARSSDLDELWHGEATRGCAWRFEPLTSSQSPTRLTRTIAMRAASHTLLTMSLRMPLGAQAAFNRCHFRVRHFGGVFLSLY